MMIVLLLLRTVFSLSFRWHFIGPTINQSSSITKTCSELTTDYTHDIYPAKRSSAGVVSIEPFRNSFFMFGGFTHNITVDQDWHQYGELWEYDIVKGWKLYDTRKDDCQTVRSLDFFGEYGIIPSPIIFPGARNTQPMVYYHKLKSIFLFGGEGFNRGHPRTFYTFGDLWEFDILSKLWRWFNINGKGETIEDLVTSNWNESEERFPGARDISTLVINKAVLPDTLVLFGGDRDGVLNDLWFFDISSCIWSPMLTDNDQMTMNSHGNYEGTGQYPGVVMAWQCGC